MRLADRVAVSRRFQRAIRIDTDLDDPSALGRVCLCAIVSCGLGNDGSSCFGNQSGCFYLDRALWYR